MHFTGIIERPNNPNLIQFFKQGNNQDKLTQEYSNDKYQNMTDSMSFYDAFQKRMALDSNERPRPRIGVKGEAFELTSDGVHRELASDDPYHMLSSEPHSQHFDQRPRKMGTGKGSIGNKSGMASSVNYYGQGQ